MAFTTHRAGCASAAVISTCGSFSSASFSQGVWAQADETAAAKKIPAKRLHITANVSIRKLRILLVTDYSTLSGGEEVLTSHLRDRLRQQGHEVCWLSSSAGLAPQADRLVFGTTSRWRGLTQAANPWAAAG